MSEPAPTNPPEAPAAAAPSARARWPLAVLGGGAVASIVALSVLLYWSHEARRELGEQSGRQVREREAEIAKLSARVSELEGSLEETTGQLEQTTTRLESTVKERDGLAAELAETKQTLDRTQKELIEARAGEMEQRERAERAAEEAVRTGEALQLAKKLQEKERERATEAEDDQKEEMTALLERIRNMRREMEAATRAALNGETPAGEDGGAAPAESLADLWVGDPTRFLDKLRKVSVGVGLDLDAVDADEPAVDAYKQAVGTLAMGIIRWTEGRDHRFGHGGAPKNPIAAREAFTQARDHLKAAHDRLTELAEGPAAKADPELPGVLAATGRYLERTEDWLASN